MPGAIDPIWPVVLTDKDWQKKKGTIAKVTAKTGLGTQMIKAYGLFKKINFDKFEAQRAIPLPHDRDIPNIVKAKQNAMTFYKSQVEPTRNELKKLRDMAKKVSDDWKKSKTIPSSATKAALDVANAADSLSMELLGNSHTMAPRIASFDTMIETKKKAADEEIKKLAVTITNLEKALGEVAKTPTKAFWSAGNTSAHQRCRSMCNTIRVVPVLKGKYWKTWQPFGDEYHKKAPDGPQEAAAVKKMISNVETALKVFKANYQKDLQSA
jgi:hypothetical protein